MSQPTSIANVEEAAPDGRALVVERQIDKASFVDFKVEQFSTMAYPPVSVAKQDAADADGVGLYVECPFNTRDGKIKKLTLSPKYLKTLMHTNPIHLATVGTSHYYVYSQQIDGIEKKYAPLPMLVDGKPNKKGKLCVVSAIRLVRHMVPHTEVGNEELREGAEKLIVKVNKVSGLAYPKSIPFTMSSTKAEEKLCAVIREVSAASSLKVGQRVGRYSSIESIDDDPSDANSYIVKFEPVALSGTLAR